MTKTAAAARFTQGVEAKPLARGATLGRAEAGPSVLRPFSLLADRVKTLLDRTLDAARGRYEM